VLHCSCPSGLERNYATRKGGRAKFVSARCWGAQESGGSAAEIPREEPPVIIAPDDLASLRSKARTRVSDGLMCSAAGVVNGCAALTEERVLAREFWVVTGAAAQIDATDSRTVVLFKTVAGGWPRA
jgi:hypothetical protein